MNTGVVITILKRKSKQTIESESENSKAKCLAKSKLNYCADYKYQQLLNIVMLVYLSLITILCMHLAERNI